MIGVPIIGVMHHLLVEPHRDPQGTADGAPPGEPTRALAPPPDLFCCLLGVCEPRTADSDVSCRYSSSLYRVTGNQLFQAETVRGGVPMVKETSTVFELAVLGLLAESPMHGYELRKRLNATLGSFRAFSFGSLYPTLRRLQTAGHIATEGAAVGGDARRGTPRYLHRGAAPARPRGLGAGGSLAERADRAGAEPRAR